jgi:hypothetical protein
MLELQPESQFSDGGSRSSRQAFDSQQQLVLLRFKTEAANLLLAEVEKTPNLKPELRQGTIPG